MRSLFNLEILAQIVDFALEIRAKQRLVFKLRFECVNLLERIFQLQTKFR